MKLRDVLSQIKENQSGYEEDYFNCHFDRYYKVLNIIDNMGIRSGRVLDVGCYPYHIGLALEKCGFDVHGITGEHFPISRKNVKICNIEIDKFPFPDNFFDFVIFTEVFEHIPRSPVLTLREINRVSNYKSKLILTTPNIARSGNRFKLLFGKSIMYPLEYLLENNGEGSILYNRHVREYTRKEVSTLLKESGWNVILSKHIISYTPNKLMSADEKRNIKVFRNLTKLRNIGKWMNHYLMLLFPSFRDTIVIVAEK